MGSTSVDLYRSGNASSPRMDHVRSKDIDIYDQSGVDWVRAGTGGISTFTAIGPAGQNWWRLEAGYDYGVILLVWNDHGRHWLWEPSRDMRLSSFRFELAKAHDFFVRI